jgi:predicted DNA-binding transcriptional regulator AlpA
VPNKSLSTFAPRAIDLVNRDEAQHILGDISTATLYRGVASGRYPAPVKIGPNTSRWDRAKLEAYVRQLETAACVAPRQHVVGHSNLAPEFQSARLVPSETRGARP